MKIEHEKKLAALQSQEYRGGGEAKLDKTKASIKSLQSLIVVTSQAVSTTTSAIIGQRDSELVPQLVELCHGYVISLLIFLFIGISFLSEIFTRTHVVTSYHHSLGLVISYEREPWILKS